MNVTHTATSTRWAGFCAPLVLLPALMCAVGLFSGCDPTDGAAAPDDDWRASVSPSASSVGGPAMTVILLTEREQKTGGSVVDLVVRAEPDILTLTPPSEETGFMAVTGDDTTLLGTAGAETIPAVQFTAQATCKSVGSTRVIFAYKRSQGGAVTHATGQITCSSKSNGADDDAGSSDAGSSDTGSSDTVSSSDAASGDAGSGTTVTGTWNGPAKLSGVSTKDGKPVKLTSGCLQSPGSDVLVVLDGQKAPESGKNLKLQVGAVFEKGYPLCNVFVGAKLTPPGFTGGTNVLLTAKELRVGGAKGVPITGLTLPAVVLLDVEVDMATKKLSAKVSSADQKTLASGEFTLPDDVFSNAQSGDNVGALFIDADLCQYEVN